MYFRHVKNAVATSIPIVSLNYHATLWNQPDVHNSIFTEQK
jgi:hypothetical protein